MLSTARGASQPGAETSNFSTPIADDLAKHAHHPRIACLDAGHGDTGVIVTTYGETIVPGGLSQSHIATWCNR